jgi:hypothetical protein
MKLRNFFSIVPKAVQLWAWILLGLTFLIGLITAFTTSDQGAMLRTASIYGAAALVTGIWLAIWVLCLGFVFADAKRRGMRAALWVLVAALFPNLLGFLLYFVLRQPIAATCTHCGMAVPSHQPFCSWCGASQLPRESPPAASTETAGAAV